MSEPVEQIKVHGWPYSPTQPKRRPSMETENWDLAKADAAAALPPGGEPMPEEFLDPGAPIDNPTIEQRVYAACRWAAALAVKELVDGAELTMPMRDAGPAAFMPGSAEWERINETSKIGIAYVMGES